jgi:hypothetical protein
MLRFVAVPARGRDFIGVLRVAGCGLYYDGSCKEHPAPTTLEGLFIGDLLLTSAAGYSMGLRTQPYVITQSCMLRQVGTLV